jgi:hypothetical protein
MLIVVLVLSVSQVVNVYLTTGLLSCVGCITLMLAVWKDKRLRKHPGYVRKPGQRSSREKVLSVFSAVTPQANHCVHHAVRFSRCTEVLAGRSGVETDSSPRRSHHHVVFQHHPRPVLVGRRHWTGGCGCYDFHLVVLCNLAVRFQFFNAASLGWNLVWVVNFTFELYDPLRNTRSLVKYYHLFVWMWSLATVAFLWSSHIYGCVVAGSVITGCCGHTYLGFCLETRPGADGSCYVNVSGAAWGLFQGPILVVLLAGLASVGYAIYRLPRSVGPLSVLYSPLWLSLRPQFATLCELFGCDSHHTGHPSCPTEASAAALYVRWNLRCVLDLACDSPHQRAHSQQRRVIVVGCDRHDSPSPVPFDQSTSAEGSSAHPGLASLLLVPEVHSLFCCVLDDPSIICTRTCATVLEQDVPEGEAMVVRWQTEHER